MSDRKRDYAQAHTRTERVLDVLRAFDGREIAVTRGVNGKLRWWLASDQLFLLQEYKGCGGVEVFAPLTTGSSIDELITAMKRRLVESK